MARHFKFSIWWTFFWKRITSFFLKRCDEIKLETSVHFLFKKGMDLWNTRKFEIWFHASDSYNKVCGLVYPTSLYSFPIRILKNFFFPAKKARISLFLSLWIRLNQGFFDVWHKIKKNSSLVLTLLVSDISKIMQKSHAWPSLWLDKPTPVIIFSFLFISSCLSHFPWSESIQRYLQRQITSLKESCNNLKEKDTAYKHSLIFKNSCFDLSHLICGCIYLASFLWKGTFFWRNMTMTLLNIFFLFFKHKFLFQKKQHLFLLSLEIW